MVPTTTIDNRHRHDVLLRIINSLRDRISDFICFSETDSDVTVAVTDHNDCIETETASALHHLRNTVDVDEFVFEIEFACFDPCQVCASLFSVMH